jgi:hypothetical protein
MRIRNRRQIVTLLATAVPAGVLTACQSAPAAPAKPAAAPATDKLLLMADLVQGSKNIPDAQKPMRSCVLSSRFARNSEMVWRIRVHDPRSGEPMDDKALKMVQVDLANGKTLEARWGPHPKDPPNELFWTTSWVVPKDQPTGTLKYTIAATAVDGRIGKFEPFPTTASLPTLIEEVLPDAPTAPAAPAKPKA